jgi:peptidyl-tRNA hydrolase, PTH1 family
VDGGIPEPVLVVGLGNPGPEYRNTRHNAGFMALDLLRETLRAAPLESTRRYESYEGFRQDRKILLLYPLTYMNRSGSAVSEATARYAVDAHRCIVIYDDLNLPLGSIRIRPRGSAGGHNGLDSIMEVLGTRDIPRVRLGIYNARSFSSAADASAFVLSDFTADELPAVKHMIHNAHDAVLTMVERGIERAMNSYNKTTENPN